MAIKTVILALAECLETQKMHRLYLTQSTAVKLIIVWVTT